MRALTIGSMYPPHHLGGYELVWRDAVRLLADRGHAVRVLASDHRDPAAGGELEPDVHRELRWYWSDHGWPRLSLRERARIERDNAEILDRHLAEFEPDVVGWWAMGGMSLSLIERVRRRGIPAAGIVCDGWLIYGPQVDGWMRATRWPLGGPLAERITGIPARVDFAGVGPWLFPSEHLRSRSAEARGLRRTSVQHQGVDREVFRPARRPPWRGRLLYVGRVDPRKGIALAVEALAHLPLETTLEVVGDGDEVHLAELRALAGRLGVGERVRFEPREPRERLQERYAEADALVFPVVWQEPWGLIPLEAMSVGLPVVASGRGGSGEYLRGGVNCMLFDPDMGGKALAAAVGELARDDELRIRLAEGGAKSSASIGRDDFSEAVERTLLDVIEERS